MLLCNVQDEFPANPFLSVAMLSKVSMLTRPLNDYVENVFHGLAVIRKKRIKRTKTAQSESLPT